MDKGRTVHLIVKIAGFALMALLPLHVIGEDEGPYQGEVLWWMVGDVGNLYHNLSGLTISDFDGTVLPHNSDGSYTVRGMDVNAARVRVSGNNIDPDAAVYLPLVSAEGGTVQLINETGYVPDYFFAAVVPYNDATYSFTIELGNYYWDEQNETANWVTLAVSETASYTKLADEKKWITTWSDNPDPTQTGLYWHPNAYTVPEPSGGLLLLIGGGLLALRRRRKAWR